MSRKINSKLLERMTSGDLLPLLNYIKSDNDLRIEVRQGGKAFVYYRKGKALEIGLRKFSVDEKYVRNTAYSIPDMDLLKSNPTAYFKQMKIIIDNYVDNRMKRKEFDVQQNIASCNQGKYDKYIIIDMEYAFPQDNLEETKREKRASFDLLGLERETGKVVFFEVKTGGDALAGNAGIKTHIEDFERYLFGKNKEFFREILKNDIINIISDKRELGILDYSLPESYEIDDDNIDVIFVYQPDTKTSIRDYCKTFNQEVNKTKLKRQYNTLYVSPENKYKLLYRESERIRVAEWRNRFLDKEDSFILNEGKQNLYPDIADKAIEYFLKNNITWWTCTPIGDIDTMPTRHLLSSQISCINHLFPLKHDKQAVLAIAQVICPEVESVFEITTDISEESTYIAFEQVSDFDHLYECNKGEKPTRGKMCTSIDALIYGRLKNQKKILLPIEWKYTECYDNKDYSNEDRYKEEKGENGKGKERLRRYVYEGKYLLPSSKQLKKCNDYKSSIYFFEPFYQLMRQTLWVEQMIDNKEIETLKADNYLHTHIIPSENTDLLNKRYLRSGKRMEATWRDCLVHQDRYKIISPKDLLASIDKTKYKSLIIYLSERYWLQ